MKHILLLYYLLDSQEVLVVLQPCLYFYGYRFYTHFLVIENWGYVGILE